MEFYVDLDELLERLELDVRAERENATDGDTDDAIAKHTPGEHGRTNNTPYDER